jgi:hypothetical protein
MIYRGNDMPIRSGPAVDLGASNAGRCHRFFRRETTTTAACTLQILSHSLQPPSTVPSRGASPSSSPHNLLRCLSSSGRVRSVQLRARVPASRIDRERGSRTLDSLGCTQIFSLHNEAHAAPRRLSCGRPADASASSAHVGSSLSRPTSSAPDRTVTAPAGISVL